jgi:hypothetical protein
MIWRNNRTIAVRKSKTDDRAKWQIRSPLVPQWVDVGDGWIVGFLVRSPFYYFRPPIPLHPEDISNFFHLWDE